MKRDVFEIIVIVLPCVLPRAEFEYGARNKDMRLRLLDMRTVFALFG